ncbi:cytochrome P450 [Reinekea blandensis]|uniref:Possible cytochrome P450 family proteins n=1 Tax=Reinekea blandensis MED297 TaxID=314283 RepID=A4BAW7_9GAMM|nr:cytochrome P450 [Reinekea blandensis]EAR10580.1 possible cytochrome P450 family proteins [Reinekea sp. MED297] [Reinekea blandensis MED297]
MNSQQQVIREIPGDRGWPLVGHTLSILKDIQAFFDRKTRQHGAVFSTQFLGEEWIRLTGPDACQWLLQDKDNNFSTKLGWESFVGDLFPRGLMLKDGDDHLYHRRIMQSAFQKSALARYQQMMHKQMPELLQEMPSQQSFDAADQVRNLLLDIASNVFIGESDVNARDKLQKAFRTTVAATMAIIRKPIPGTLYKRGLDSRAYLERYFLAKVPQKRNDESGNLFAALTRAKDEDGNNFSDQEIADHMIFLLMAAQDTTSSALTSLFYMLAEHPQWQERLREEYQAISEFTYESLEQMPQTSWVFKEVLRMCTPGAVIPRRSLREVEYNGYRIPADTIVSVSPIHNHYLPEYWTSPDTFDPERFSPERAEDKQHPYLFAPFSGGVHKCIGLHFAEMEIKVILFHLLQRFQISRDESEKVNWQKAPVWQPKGGLTVQLTPLTE